MCACMCTHAFGSRNHKTVGEIFVLLAQKSSGIAYLFVYALNHNVEFWFLILEDNA